MIDFTEKRQGPNRRRTQRGGRRATDALGAMPLVMVVDPDTRRRDVSEAILAKLRFAVAPVESIERAVAVVQTLNPEVIVASEEDARQLSSRLPPRPLIPIVTLAHDARVSDALIDAVRRALRVATIESGRSM